MSIFLNLSNQAAKANAEARAQAVKAEAQAAEAAQLRAESQPAREQNIAAICEYIAAGCKTEPGRLGIELEQHIVNAEDLSPVAYDAPHGSRWILEQFSANAGEGSCSFSEAMYTPDGAIIGAARKDATLTLEPAAQLELSAGPFENLTDAAEVLGNFETCLNALLEPVGERAVPLGYHPTSRALDLTLIPKVRYKYMNHYLSNVSKYGPCMMRGSASTQVSIDFTDEADCTRKMRLANLCAPLFSLICDNSPVFEGAPRTEQLARTRIWRHLDPARCGIAPGSAEDGFSWRAYAEWILDTPAIVAPGDAAPFPTAGSAGCDECFPTSDCPCAHVAPEAAAAAASPHVTAEAGWHYDVRTFGELYAEEAMTQADVEHALSMVFPDVRLKRFLEIRPADALPAAYAVAFAALVKGLFYSEVGLNGLEELFAGQGAKNAETAKTALMAFGYEASVYGRPVAEAVDELFALAAEGLGDEAHYLEPLADLAAQRLTPADAGIVTL